MEVLILACGQLNIELLHEVYSSMEDPYVIGVDRGTLVLLREGIPVSLAVGDFDSVREEERVFLDELMNNAQNKVASDKAPITFEVLKPEKDDTDLEHALRMALSLDPKPERIIMLGCTGGRIDHTFAAVGLLKLAADAGVEAYIVDDTNRVRVARGMVELRREELYGKYISVIPYGDAIHGLTEKGLKYEVENVDLTFEIALGVSNELLQDRGYISCDDYMIIMETRD